MRLQRTPTPHRTATHPLSDQKLVLDLAHENPHWAQKDPGRTDRTRTPDRHIDSVEDPELGRHRTRPAPNRSQQFLATQARGIIAADFFHLDTALGKRLYALVFLGHGTRRLHIAGITQHPTQDWTTHQARNLTTDANTGARPSALRFLLRDRDTKYSTAFDAVFQAEDMNILTSAPQTPKMNAHCERVIRTSATKSATTS
jgi:putative transposase